MQRKPLKPRDYQVDLESRLGKTQVCYNLFSFIVSSLFSDVIMMFSIIFANCFFPFSKLFVQKFMRVLNYFICVVCEFLFKL